MTVSSNYSAYSSNSTSSVSSASQKGKPDFEKMAQELLSSLDTDKSGSIDKAEFSAAAQALASSSSNNTTSSSSATDVFNTLDTNSDGSMSTEELVASLKNMKPPATQKGQDGGMPPPPSGGMPPPSDSSSTSKSSSSSEFVDIRFKEEQASWGFPFMKQIPLNELPDRLNELDKNKTIVTVCPHYDRAEIARLYLTLKEYKSRYLNDGLLGLADYLRGDEAKEFIVETSKK